MLRFMIYFFPAAADVIVAAALFVCSNRLAEAGRSRTEVAMVFAAWAIVYIASNQILARVVTSRNAAVMLIISNLLFSITSGAFVLIECLWAVYAIMGVLAVTTALFFLPFQVFMKAVESDPHQGVIRSVALYTFSWSLGFGGGPLITGFIYQWWGWRWCFAFTGLLGLITAFGVQLLKHHAKHHHSEVVAPDQSIYGQSSCKGEMNYHAMPDLAWLGWIMAGVGCMGIYSFLALLPSVGVDFEISKSQIGLIIALLYIVQALVGLSFLRSRTWMFRPGPSVGLATFGLLGLMSFGVSLLPIIDGIEIWRVPLRMLGLYASVICYGVFSGSFFFALVFYSLVHPYHSERYVAMNETVVGVCGVLGPVMAGTLADKFGFTVPSALLAGMIAIASVLQFIVLKRLTGKLG